MTDDHHRQPLGPGEQALAHWAFTLDFADRDGTGASAGEVMLRSDGALLRRAGWERYAEGHSIWRFEPWRELAGWSGTDVEAAFAWLRRHGYVLYPPTGTPLDVSVSEPLPRSTGRMEPLRAARTEGAPPA